eukprot:EG_transcript_3507
MSRGHSVRCPTTALLAPERRHAMAAAAAPLQPPEAPMPRRWLAVVSLCTVAVVVGVSHLRSPLQTLLLLPLEAGPLAPVSIPRSASPRRSLEVRTTHGTSRPRQFSVGAPLPRLTTAPAATPMRATPQPVGVIGVGGLLALLPAVAAAVAFLARRRSRQQRLVGWRCAAHAGQPKREEPAEGSPADASDTSIEVEDDDSEEPAGPDDVVLGGGALSNSSSSRPLRVVVSIGDDNRNVNVRIAANSNSVQEGRGLIHIKLGNANDTVGVTVDDSEPPGSVADSPAGAESPAEDAASVSSQSSTDLDSSSSDTEEEPKALKPRPARGKKSRKKKKGDAMDDVQLVIVPDTPTAPAPDKSQSVMALAAKVVRPARGDCPEPGPFTGWVAELYRQDKLRHLEEQMNFCATTENYTEAARLRNELAKLLLPEDKKALLSQLEAAVQANRFQDAMVLRDKLRALEAQRWAHPIDAKELRRGYVILRVNPGTGGLPEDLRCAVVLMLMHNRSGSMGLVLNSLLGPATVATAEHFQPEINALNEVCDSPWLYNGGVATVRSLSVLHQQRAAMSATDVDVSTARFDLFANTRHVAQVKSTFISTIKALKHERHCPNATRFFSGHMVWQPGVLEREVKSGLWFPAAIAPALLFSDTAGEQLWSEVFDLMEEWCQQHLRATPAKDAKEKEG